MNGLLRQGLRTVAILIAIMGVIDPVTTAVRSTPMPVDIAVYGLALGDGTGASTAGISVETTERSLQTMAEALGDRAVIHRLWPTSPLPCRGAVPCVVISDRTAPIEVPSDFPGSLSVVRVGDALSPNVAIVEASAAPVAYLGAEAIVTVTLQGTGVAGRKTRVRVGDSYTTAGETTHTWTADGEATVAVRWWPLNDHPRGLFVSVDAFESEATMRDNSSMVSMGGAPAPMPVLVFEPRPSWTSTFVRRALESDPRLEIQSRSRLGPTVAVGSERARLDEETLIAAQAVVIGAPESLSAQDVALLDRYVRIRGGTLVLLPDRPIEGPVARLVPGMWTERVSAEAVPVGAVRASELLTIESPDARARILASTSDPARPAIVSFPSGRGQIVVSGAMDAWRYRNPGFNRFWQSLVASAATAGGPTVSITASPSLAWANEQVELSVVRRTFAIGAPAAVAATVTCGDDRPETIRLWPTGDPDAFTGRFRPSTSGPCRAEATLDGRPASVDAPLVHAFPSLPRRRSWAALGEAARASGGLVVRAGEERALVEMLHALPPLPPAPAERHPMRSPWWILPFAACLGVEWGDRRRRGLR